MVRHEGSDVWQALEAGSNIYLGDTFHSTARSAFVLKQDDESTLELNQNGMLVLKMVCCPGDSLRSAHPIHERLPAVK